MNGTENYLLVMDSATPQYAPTSRMIRQSEYKELYPEKDHARKLAFIFKYRKPERIPEIQALFLVKKYETLDLVDDKHVPISIRDATKALEDGVQQPDDLSDMNYFKIQELSWLYGIDRATFHSMKKVDLKKEIRRLRKLGMEPMTPEELLEKKAKRQEEVLDEAI